MNGNSFVIQDTFNVLLKDDADYEVDLVITDADYEMVHQNELKEFKIENETWIFSKLNEYDIIFLLNCISVPLRSCICSQCMNAGRIHSST